MVNLPLIFASALFYIGVTALLYIIVWLSVKMLLRALPPISPFRSKGILSAALIIPPVVTCAFTAGGAFLRHSHTPEVLHRNVFCGNIAQFLSVPEGQLPVVFGLAVQWAAWLLLAWGAVTVYRLVQATISLERGLSPYLQLPSPELAATVERMQVEVDCSRLEFFEADIPMAFSCLIGIRHIRCVLSKQLVAAATQEELDAVVLHEFNHFRSGDVWRTFLVGILNCLFSFLPPVRLLSRRWREETELACDAATARATGKPLALASAILRAQGITVQRRRLPSTTLAFAEETACPPETRVKRLLAYAQGMSAATEPPRMGAWQWMATTILLVAGLTLTLSPDAMCMAHCSLEAISHALQ